MDFPMYSLYEWNKMDEELLSEFCTVAQSMFKDIILIQDLCHSIEKSCSPKCKHHLAKDELELKFCGVNTLFKLGNVIDFDHPRTTRRFNVSYHRNYTYVKLYFRRKGQIHLRCLAGKSSFIKIDYSLFFGGIFWKKSICI